MPARHHYSIDIVRQADRTQLFLERVHMAVVGAVDLVDGEAESAPLHYDVRLRRISAWRGVAAVPLG